MKIFISSILLLFFAILISGCMGYGNNNENEKTEYQGIIDEDASFTMLISNQARSKYYDPVDITVFIDNKLVLSDYFIKDMHLNIRYDFDLEFGNHSIIVTSHLGNYAREYEFEIYQKQWAVIGFYEGGTNNSYITFGLWDHEPIFS